MFPVPRLARLFFFILLILLGPSLYLLYPADDHPPSPGDVQYEYEAGGIDSPHWREKVVPAFETEHEEARGIDEQVLAGGVIMGKLGNATAKAELGRASWKLLHLITMRFPDEPTPDDRTALKSYFHLFSRLYPCGECATEFQALLKQYPPQTSSRKAASLWLCHVHNQVNERLGKAEFDCLTLDETYDCGCGPVETDADTAGLLAAATGT